MGVVNESAYFFLGSPACIDLVDKDSPPLLFFFLRDDLAIRSQFLKKLYSLTHKLPVKSF
jgi:hypothetical protein